MPRFTNTEYRSLNESISHVANPALALAEAEEYAALLEETLVALCEEMEIDPQELVEDIQTPARKREMDKKENAAIAKAAAAQPSSYRRLAALAQYRSAKKKAVSVMQQNDAEAKSKKLYGVGGKVIATRKVKPVQNTPWKKTKGKTKEEKRDPDWDNELTAEWD